MADEELQDPEAPENDSKGKKKKKSKDGSIPLPLAIGVIVGVIIVTSMINFVMVKYVLNDDPVASDSTQAANVAKGSMEDDEEYTDEIDLDMEQEAFFEKLSERKIHETERITTNPKGSKSIVVLKLGITYVPNMDYITPEVVADASFMNKILVHTTAVTISEIGSRTEEEILNANRDSLAHELREILKPYYKDRHIFLRQVKFTEFILQ